MTAAVFLGSESPTAGPSRGGGRRIDAPFDGDARAKFLYPSGQQCANCVRTGVPDITDEAQAMKARIEIMLKAGVLDPQGKAIEGALGGLGFDGVGAVRQGKVIEIELSETDRDKARQDVERMCESLLANTVIENYRIELV